MPNSNLAHPDSVTSPGVYLLQ